jgi:hypothetical protein
MALEKYQQQPVNTVQTPIDTGASAVARVESSGASMLAAELDKFSSSIRQLGQGVANRLAAEEGVQDALAAGVELNNQIAELDSKIDEAGRLGDTKKVQELLAKKSEAITEASGKTQRNSFFAVNRVYEKAGQDEFAKNFDASLPMVAAQARQISGDDPKEFARIFKAYTDKMIADAPTPELASYMGGALVRYGSGISAQLVLNDYQKDKQMAIDNANEAATGQEQFMTDLANATIVTEDMFDPNKSVFEYSPKLAGEFGKYQAMILSDVQNGYLSEAAGQNKISNIQKKMELTVYNYNMVRAIENGDGAEFYAKANPKDGALYTVKKEMYEKSLSNQMLMNDKLEKQADAERDRISERYMDMYVTNGDYLEMDITSDPYLTTAHKRTLLSMRRMKAEAPSELKISDPNMIYGMEREELASLTQNKTQLIQLYSAWDKHDAFRNELEVAGKHTPATKLIEDETIDSVLENLDNITTPQAKKTAVVNYRIIGDLEAARKLAAEEASQLPIPINNMKSEFARIYKEKAESVYMKWENRYKQRDEINNQVKDIDAKTVEIQTQLDSDSWVNKAATLVAGGGMDRLEEHSQRMAESRAELRRITQLKKELLQKRKQLGFRAEGQF